MITISKPCYELLKKEYYHDYDQATDFAGKVKDIVIELISLHRELTSTHSNDTGLHTYIFDQLLRRLMKVYRYMNREYFNFNNFLIDLHELMLCATHPVPIEQMKSEPSERWLGCLRYNLRLFVESIREQVLDELSDWQAERAEFDIQCSQWFKLDTLVAICCLYLSIDKTYKYIPF
jgi:hypothetical protein